MFEMSFSWRPLIRQKNFGVFLTFFLSYFLTFFFLPIFFSTYILSIYYITLFFDVIIMISLITLISILLGLLLCSIIFRLSFGMFRPLRDNFLHSLEQYHSCLGWVYATTDQDI